jgi:hypothetical protein
MKLFHSQFQHGSGRFFLILKIILVSILLAYSATLLASAIAYSVLRLTVSGCFISGAVYNVYTVLSHLQLSLQLLMAFMFVAYGVGLSILIQKRNRGECQQTIMTALVTGVIFVAYSLPFCLMVLPLFNLFLADRFFIILNYVLPVELTSLVVFFVLLLFYSSVNRKQTKDYSEGQRRPLLEVDDLPRSEDVAVSLAYEE